MRGHFPTYGDSNTVVACPKFGVRPHRTDLFLDLQPFEVVIGGRSVHLFHDLPQVQRSQ